MVEKQVPLTEGFDQNLSTTGLMDEDDLSAQTVDLDQWFSSDLTPSGSFDLGLIVADSFGKLLDALPVPTLMVDTTYSVVFVNRACGKITPNSDRLRGVPFATLVPRSRNAEKAQFLLRKVFSTRKPHVADGILEFEARKIWGRLHFNSVRIGRERFVLVVIEDLTAERTALLLNQRNEKRAKKSVQDLEDILKQQDDELTDLSTRFEQEVRRHARTREILRGERRKFVALTEHIPVGVAIVDSDGAFYHINAKFRDLFALPSEGLPNGADWFEKVLADSGQAAQPFSAWLDTLTEDEDQLEPVPFKAVPQEGEAVPVAFKAVKLDGNDYLVTCREIVQ